MSVKVQGKVIQAPLGGGVYLLETADGNRYALEGGDEGLLKVGQAVSVEGEVDGGGAPGIGMTGDPVLSVKGYQVLD